MSAGAFISSRYQADATTDIYRIRVQPETLSATFGGTANAAPTGAVTMQASARSSGGNRRVGVKARSFTIRFTATPPTGYAPNQLLRVPVLTPALYNATAIGAAANYLGTAAVIVGKNAERIR